MQYSNVPSAFVLIFKLNNAAGFFTNSEQFLYFTTIAFYHVNRYKIMPLKKTQVLVALKPTTF